MYNPKLGDSVQAKSGRKLQIVQITHIEPDNTESVYFHNGPYLEIELHHWSTAGVTSRS